MEFIKIKKPIDRKKMNWAQAKWANPRLRPNADTDRDGVKNQFDCRPLNRKRQDEGLSEEMIRKNKELGPIPQGVKSGTEKIIEFIESTMEDKK